MPLRTANWLRRLRNTLTDGAVYRCGMIAVDFNLHRRSGFLVATAGPTVPPCEGETGLTGAERRAVAQHDSKAICATIDANDNRVMNPMGLAA